MTQTSIRKVGSQRPTIPGKSRIKNSLDADLFKALGDPTRLHLLACLARCCSPCAVKDVAACCNVDYSVVSRHLAQLKAAGVLTSQRSGKTTLYAVAFAPLAQALNRLANALSDADPAGRPPSSRCRCLCCQPGACSPGSKGYC